MLNSKSNNTVQSIYLFSMLSFTFIYLIIFRFIYLLIYSLILHFSVNKHPPSFILCKNRSENILIQYSVPKQWHAKSYSEMASQFNNVKSTKTIRFPLPIQELRGFSHLSDFHVHKSSLRCIVCCKGLMNLHGHELLEQILETGRHWSTKRQRFGQGCTSDGCERINCRHFVVVYKFIVFLCRSE